MRPDRLVCPNGHAELYSVEATTILFPALLFAQEGGGVTLDYDSPNYDRIVNDEGTEYARVLYCRTCGQEYQESEMLPVRMAAHRLDERVIEIDEDSDRGADTRWQAMCTAALSDETGTWACSWAGDWHRATDFVDQARRLNEPDGEHVVRRPGGEVDPGQLAFEAAEQDGREHLAQYGVASDGPTDASNEDASHGSPDREQAPQAAQGAAEGGS